MAEERSTLAEPAPVSANDAPFALAALRRMMFLRAFERACWDLSTANPPKVAGSVHLCAGQEAIPVGACAALADTDRVIATYRGHGWVIESGLGAEEVLAEVCQRDAGINGGRGGSALIMGAGHASSPRRPSSAPVRRLPMAWRWPCDISARTAWSSFRSATAP